MQPLFRPSIKKGPAGKLPGLFTKFSSLINAIYEDTSQIGSPY